MNLALIYLQMPFAEFLPYFLIAVFLMNAPLFSPVGASVLALAAGSAGECERGKSQCSMTIYGDLRFIAISPIPLLSAL